MKVLRGGGKFENFDSRYVISDLEELLKNCDNYNKRTDLIINKLIVK
ncbi:hypothetical protein [Clostridium sp.]